MIDFIKKSIAAAFAVITGIFTFVPESVFAGRGWITQGLLSKCEWLSGFEATDVNVVITRLVCFLLVWIATSAAYALFLALRRWTTIRRENYSIRRHRKSLGIIWSRIVGRHRSGLRQDLLSIQQKP